MQHLFIQCLHCVENKSEEIKVYLDLEALCASILQGGTTPVLELSHMLKT